ncbi:uncharacterized protein LOC134846720 [Symsagittifera roscoffensis]|uniref:uncharacterized protein LOC134846720 n=1 Tax=Symsagittifera roscoffensis TaxID=84072 RepID=UPI00307B6AAE
MPCVCLEYRLFPSALWMMTGLVVLLANIQMVKQADSGDICSSDSDCWRDVPANITEICRGQETDCIEDLLDENQKGNLTCCSEKCYEQDMCDAVGILAAFLAFVAGSFLFCCSLCVVGVCCICGLCIGVCVYCKRRGQNKAANSNQNYLDAVAAQYSMQPGTHATTVPPHPLITRRLKCNRWQQSLKILSFAYFLKGDNTHLISSIDNRLFYDFSTSLSEWGGGGFGSGGGPKPGGVEGVVVVGRPATSFLWFTSPWATFKHIIWKHYRWHMIVTMIIIFVVLFLALFIYTLLPPGHLLPLVHVPLGDLQTHHLEALQVAHDRHNDNYLRRPLPSPLHLHTTCKRNSKTEATFVFSANF